MDSLLAMFNPISKVNVGEEEAFKALQESMERIETLEAKVKALEDA